MVDQGSSEGEVIRAAGGLIFRDTPDGKELLVVHRRRYDDWTLPKGKQILGEDLVQTAVREVREETGYDVAIDHFAGAIAYAVDQATKVVSFWFMTVTSEARNPIDSEVSEVMWLPLDEAWKRLQYPLERALVEGVQQGWTGGEG